MPNVPPAPERGTQHDEVVAKAIAARRAARPSWRNAHFDRLTREQEAGRVSKEYRQAEKAAGKHCSSCGETLPLECFSPSHRDRPTARCKPCVAAATRERYHRDLDRSHNRIRNRRAGPERPRQTPEERQRRTAERQRKSAERQREAAERVAHLISLLTGTSPGQRIESERGWDMASAELGRLWLQSGDKVCAACKAVVAPSAMRPPAPGNFYTGKCNACASAEYRDNHLRVYGREPEGPRPIRMRDGSTITIAEFARRVAERAQCYRIKTFGS